MMGRVWVSSAAIQDPPQMDRAGEDQSEQLCDPSTAPVLSPGIYWPQGPVGSEQLSRSLTTFSWIHGPGLTNSYS